MTAAAALAFALVVAGVGSARAQDAGVPDAGPPAAVDPVEPAPRGPPLPPIAVEPDGGRFDPAPPAVEEQAGAAAEHIAAAPEPERGPTYPYFSFGLGMELEYVNVEGPGGFEHRDEELAGVPANRHGYVDLDKATLDVYAHMRSWLYARVELRTNANRRDGARIDRAYFRATAFEDLFDLWDLDLELGRNRPMARPPDRRVETYSPLGQAFWRGREWHAALDTRATFGPVELRLGASIASTRELDLQPMGEDAALQSIVYGNGGVDDYDSTAEGAFLVGARAFGARVEGFATVGRLLDNQGPYTLQNQHGDDYILLSCGLSGMSCDAIDDRTSHWLGGRLAYDDHGFFFLAEYIVNRYGNVERRGFEVGGSYTVELELSDQHVEIEPLLRYGELVITNLPERFVTSTSWDRYQTVVALLLRPIEWIELRIEYLFLGERAGIAPGATEEADVADDQLLIQLLLDIEVTP